MRAVIAGWADTGKRETIREGFFLDEWRPGTVWRFSQEWRVFRGMGKIVGICSLPRQFRP